MTNEVKNVPEIRFPEFSGEWEENKLNNYLKTSKIKNTQKKYNKQDVLSVSGYFGIVNQIEFQGRSFAGASVASYGIVETGDIVYTKSPLKSNPYGIIKVNKGESGIVSTLYAIYKPLQNVDANFVEIYFTNDLRLNKYLKPLVNKGAKNDMKVSDDNALIGDVIFPKYIEEQIKISKFFSKLDCQIELEEKKLELLEQQKRGYMQKIFSQDLRFKDNNGNSYLQWKEFNFFDVLDKIIDFRGRTPKKLDMEWSTEGYLALSAINVKKGYIDFNVEAKYGDEKLYKKWMNKNELQKGQVLFTTEAPMGNVAQVPDNRGYILSQRTIAFNTNKKITNDFLASLLSTKKVYNELLRLSSGATAKGVSQKTLKSLYITIPLSIEEQQKIGNFFNKIDNLIELQTNKMELLKQRKQGLLQKMFV